MVLDGSRTTSYAKADLAVRFSQLQLGKRCYTQTSSKPQISISPLTWLFTVYEGNHAAICVPAKYTLSVLIHVYVLGLHHAPSAGYPQRLSGASRMLRAVSERVPADCKLQLRVLYDSCSVLTSAQILLQTQIHGNFSPAFQVAPTVFDHIPSIMASILPAVSVIGIWA